MAVAELSRLLDTGRPLEVLLAQWKFLFTAADYERRLVDVFGAFFYDEFKQEKKLATVTIHSVMYLSQQLLMQKLRVQPEEAKRLSGEILGRVRYLMTRVRDVPTGTAREALFEDGQQPGANPRTSGVDTPAVGLEHPGGC